MVYRAHHQAFRASVALKCLKIPGALSGEAQAEFLERFREEAELLFRLSASLPNVVRPLHVGALSLPSGAFVPFIALEWLEGEVLSDVITRRAAQGRAPLALESTVTLLAPVAAALDKAHRFPGPDGELAILHRDLKPENIFVAQINGLQVPKILDFGIGKVKSVASAIAGRQSTRVESMNAFTPAYAAPEQWAPKRYGQTGPWTDVYSLALTLVETVLGRPPIDGDPAAMMGAAMDPERRPTPRTEGLAVSSAVEDVFQRALRVDPRSRYQSVSHFWHDLESALGMARSEAAELHLKQQSPVARRGNIFTSEPPPAAAGGGLAPRSVVAIPDLLPAAAPSAPAPAPSAPRVDARAATPPSAPERGAPGPASSGAALFGGKELDEPEDSAPLHLADSVVPPPRTSGPPPVSSLPRPPRVGVALSVPVSVEPTASLKGRLRGPITLVVLAIAIGAVDFIYTAVMGASLALGPVRASYVAAPLALAGLALVATRLFATE